MKSFEFFTRQFRLQLPRASWGVLLLLVVGWTIPGSSQTISPMYESGHTRGIEITPFVGYQFGGSHNVYEGEINIDDAENFGIAVNFDLPYKTGTQFELLWIMQKSRLDKKDYFTGITEPLFNLYTHYMQLGGVYGLQRNNVLPFISLSFGAVLFHPTSARYSDEWFFSASLGGGLKFYLTERVGLRLQARALFPLIWGSGGLWCGTGGCSVGIGSTTTIVQGDVTAGLIIRL